MKIFYKAFRFLTVVSFIVSSSLDAMLPGLVSVIARNTRNIRLQHVREVASSSAISPSALCFAQQVSKSSAAIQEPCLRPLRAQLSQYASTCKRTNSLQSITQVWREGLDRSYENALSNIKQNGKFTNNQWQTFEKYRKYAGQKNSLSHNAHSHKPGELIVASDFDQFLDVVVEFGKHDVPSSSTVYIECCDDAMAKSMQVFVDKARNVFGGQKHASLSKIKKIEEISNIIYIACSDPLVIHNEVVLGHCLKHELQHLIHNDVLINMYLQSRFKNRISDKTWRNYNHVVEYRADLLTGVKDLKSASLMVRALSDLVEFYDVFASVATVSHPAWEKRLNIAKLLYEHLEAKNRLENN